MGTDGADAVPDSAVIRDSLTEPRDFAVIFDRHAEVVHRYLASRVGVGAADDLLSEVFVAAFRRRGTYDQRYRSAVPWLLGIATNVARHHHRSEGRRRALLQRLDGQPSDRPDVVGDDLSEEIVGRSELDQVQRAVEAIDERYRDVLLLYSSFDLSYAEIAEALGLRVGTVRSRLSRGRRQLRELLAGCGQYESVDEQRVSRRNEIEGTPL